MIVNDNDMEVILNGSQEQVIKKMLANRIFCLLKLPAKKPERCRSDFSSSVFVSNMNSLPFSRALAIRNIWKLRACSIVNNGHYGFL
jgi:hypothetical protein